MTIAITFIPSLVQFHFTDFLLNYHPYPIIILSFMLPNTILLQSRKATFDGALTHRQSLRHLFAGDCRRIFDEIQYFLLMLSEFRLRHVSVIVSDIRGSEEAKMMVWTWVGVDLNYGFNSSLYPSNALVSLQMRVSPLPRFSI